jgi:hypothetical protein
MRYVVAQWIYIQVHEVDNPFHWTDIVKRILSIAGLIIGLYFIVRAAAEPFLIDVNDSATYRNDWGGPSLAGVLAVHCGPGILAAAIIAGAVLRRYSKTRNRLVKP